MNHYKTYLRKTYPRMVHSLTYTDNYTSLTYTDNYSVGYFRNQVRCRFGLGDVANRSLGLLKRDYKLIVQYGRGTSRTMNAAP